MNGERVPMLIDTGATYTSISLDLARRRLGITPKSPNVMPAGRLYTANGKPIETYAYTLPSLTIDGIRFENVSIRLADFDDDAQVVLGMNQIKHLRLYFSFGEGLIHVTAADATKAVEPPKQ